MPSDSQDPTRREHRESSASDGSSQPSKRRKHLHRRHRHRSRQLTEDEEEVEVEMEGKKSEEKKEDSLPPPIVSGSLLAYDDVEEGEIVEDDEGFNRGNGDAVKTSNDSDVESGEFRAGDNFETGVHITQDELGHNSSFSLEDNINISGRKIKYLGRSSSQNYANGVFGQEVVKESCMPLSESQFPRKSSRKQKSYYEDGIDSMDGRKSSSSGYSGDKHENMAFSPFHYRSHGKVHKRNKSESRDRVRERSRSRSIAEEASHWEKRVIKDDLCPMNDRKTPTDFDNGRIVGRRREYQHDSRDLLGEHWSSYNGRGEDRSHSRKVLDRGREGSQDTWDKDRERREVDKDRKKERDRDREREKSRDWDRGRERGREWDKERELERKSRRERERGKEREWERERDSGRDSIRGQEMDKESVRFGRRCDRHDETNLSGDRTGKNHTAKMNPMGKDKDKIRDEDEQEDYQERIALQLVDQEDEDINRIKEESRRRRQAILEKYKTQHLQQQNEPHLEDKEKEHTEQSSDQVATINETICCESESVDTISKTLGKSLQKSGISALDRTSVAGGLGEGTPKSEKSVDVFCDDIFGESPAEVRKTGKGDGLVIERSGLYDNWDDAEGYYSYRCGEILDGRYEVTAAHGKGVFSTVVRAKDLKAGLGNPDEVAIKIIRNNELMHKAGKEELIILKKLVGADPDNKRHCVRFLSSFKYRNHLCLVFESLHMNLREVLKKFGRNIGLKLTAVRTYAKQLFSALKHLRNCGVLHCDIKPDNMLVNEAKNVLKLCDFGNAMFAGKNEITPYLVSRFYRAPEIILGLPYDHPMDIWSVGCCLFELYAGKVLFPGATNNDMLRLHMELKGPFPKKMIRKGGFTDQHFDHSLNFLATEEDPVTKKTIKRLITSIKPKDISAIVTSSPGEDLKMLADFRDLLEKVFILDPDKRITVSQALSHPFITGK